MPSMSLKVAVIGAGVSGLIAAHELHKEGHRVTIFEKSDKLGGIWVYDPRVESDPMSLNPDREIVHGSIYLSLRTNLPRSLMSFTDFDFTEREYGDPKMFPGHREVLSFLNDFANRFGLVGLIRFNTEVVRVEQLIQSGCDRDSDWVIGTRKLNGKTEMEEVFEAVIICNGNNTVPYVADVPGMGEWRGEQLHSHNYRVPEPFTDKVVVVIGDGPSAKDISKDISRLAKEVHLSSRSPAAGFSKLEGSYDNMWQHTAIDYVNEDGTVAFRDGSSVCAQVILHCTGYNYEFPFLKTNGIVSVDDKRVGPLYKHVFPPEFAPRLSFIGLPNKAIIFKTAELQSKWAARVLSGKVGLPSKEEMMADTIDYYKQMEELKRPKHHTHTLFSPDEAEYLNWLAAESGAAPVEEWKIELFRNQFNYQGSKTFEGRA